MTLHGAECPKCWARKGYEREAKGFRSLMMRLLGMLSLECHHCYHRFSRHRISLRGCRLTPLPKLAVETPGPHVDRESYAAQHMARRAA